MLVHGTLENATVLKDAALEIDGVLFYGSPWTPEYHPEHWVFNIKRGPNAALCWAQIPAETNVLITHGPPYKILDKCFNGNVGCEQLAKRVKELKQLRAHVFGHIHECAGRSKGIHHNVASLNAKYQTRGTPYTVIDV
jgi:Icc-related predicted phosphoesterase